MEFSERFRKLRLEAGLTGTALARPRYTVSYVSQIESGRRRPSPEALEFFARRLGVSPQFLATGIPEGIEVSLQYRLEEARRELRAGSPEEAQATLRGVAAQAREYGLGRIHAQALALTGEALAAEGRFREAIGAFEDALEGDLGPRDRGMAVAGLARAYRAAGDLAYAASVIESFLAEQDGRPLDPGVVTDLQSVLVSIYFERGEVVRAERAARRALASADAATPLEVRAVAYWNASRIMAETRNWDEALDLARRARVLMEETDDRRRVARLHNAYAFICLEIDPPRLEEARHHLDQAERLFADGAAPGDLAYVYTERSRLALLSGNLEEALDHADRAIAAAQGEDLELGRSLFLRGRALAGLGRGRESREALGRAASLFRQHGARQQEAACWREIGELHLEAGELEAAVQALRAGLEALDPRRSRA
jgi:tetratricopeptide (TPR) repeat protein